MIFFCSGAVRGKAHTAMAWRQIPKALDSDLEGMMVMKRESVQCGPLFQGLSISVDSGKDTWSWVEVGDEQEGAEENVCGTGDEQEEKASFQTFLLTEPWQKIVQRTSNLDIQQLKMQCSHVHNVQGCRPFGYCMTSGERIARDMDKLLGPIFNLADLTAFAEGAENYIITQCDAAQAQKILSSEVGVVCVCVCVCVCIGLHFSR